MAWDWLRRTCLGNKMAHVVGLSEEEDVGKEDGAGGNVGVSEEDVVWKQDGAGGRGRCQHMT
jgi:hypothetical protein